MPSLRRTIKSLPDQPPVDKRESQARYMEKALSTRKDLTGILLILGVVLVSYFNASFNGFVFDDRTIILNNPDIRGWDRLPLLFTTGYWSSIGQTGGLYRPLTLFSYLVEYSLVGLKPALYHIDNIILHFLCSVTAFFMMKSFFKDEKAPLFAALLFAAHPVHTEAVANTVGRAELMSTFFAFFSALVFLNRRGKGWTVLYSLLFLLSILSKESGVVMPALLAVYLLVFEPPAGQGRGRLVSLVSRLYPYALTLILYIAARYYVLKGVGPAGKEMTFINVTPYYIFLTMCEAFTHYIRLTFFPFNLTADYAFPPPFSFFEIKVIFPWAVLALLVIFSRRLMASSRPVFFAGIWFFVALFPVSNIIPIGMLMSERALYIPSLSACMILGAAAGYAWASSRWRLHALFILITIVALFAAGAIRRNPAWRDQGEFELSQVAMYRHRVELFPDYSPYYSTLANLYVNSNNYGPETEALLKEALRLDPGNFEAHIVYAGIFLKRSMPGQALDEARLCIKALPGQAAPYNIAGVALHMLKRNDEAEGMLDWAIRLDPKVGQYYLNKGIIRMEAGDYEAALALFNHATELDQGLFDAFLQQGIILGSQKRFEAAAEKLRRAVEITPKSPDAHFYLGTALFCMGDTAGARSELGEALKIKPDYTEAQALMGKLPQ